MDRNEAQGLLPQYADGELDAEPSRAIEALLADSPELRDELERWAALRRATNRAVMSEPVPAGLEDRIRASLATAGGGRNLRTYRLFLGVTGIAAAIVLAVIWWPALLGGDLSSGTVPGPTPPLVAARLVSGADFTKIHEHCAVVRQHPEHEFKLGERKIDSARQVLADHLCFDVLVPDLSGSGYELEGCCDCFGCPGITAAHVFYRPSDPGSQAPMLSFFILKDVVRIEGGAPCPPQCGPRRDYETATVGGVTVLKWCAEKHSYAVAGALAADELQSIAVNVQVANALRAPPAIAMAD